MDDEKLIILVQKYPELYDTNDENYMNTIRRMNCWEEIAAELNGATAEECKKRWVQIRENYRRAKVRNCKTTTGQAATKKKPLRFEKELSFLSDSICDQRRQISNVNNSNVTEATVDNEQNDEQEDNITNLSNEDINSPSGNHVTAPVLSPASPASAMASPSLSPGSQSPSPTADVSAFKAVPRYGRKAQKSPIAEYFKYKKELQDNKQCSKNRTDITGKNDHLSKFFQAMEESVRGFPPYLQVEAKTSISAIVLKLEGQALQVTQPEYLQYPQFPGINQQVPVPGQFAGNYHHAPDNSYYNAGPSNQWATNPSNPLVQPPPNPSLQPPSNIASQQNYRQQNENFSVGVEDSLPVIVDKRQPSGI